MTSDDTDMAALVDGLRRITPSHLPQPLFEAVARLFVTPTFMVVPLFRREDQTRVLLTRRAPDDADYAGLLHPPGKIMLATDDNFAASLTV